MKPFKLKFFSIGKGFVSFKTNIFILLVICILLSCEKNEEPEPVEKPDDSSVFDISQEYSAEYERDRLGTFQTTADFIPTGISLEPNVNLQVEVSLLKGNELPVLLIGTYARHEWDFKPKNIPLSEGFNKIINTSSNEELVYFKYVSDNPNSEAMVTFYKPKKIPFYKLGETTNAEFVEMLNDTNYIDVQLCSNKAIVVASKTNVLKYKSQDWNALLLTLDEIIKTEAYISGLDSSSSAHIPSRNRYLLTESEETDLWMASTNYVTFYNKTLAINYLISNRLLRNDGWGPWHELGHQNQLKNITWNEVVEVTVNVYSLAVQRSFGLPSRLKTDNTWKNVDIYFKIPITERNFNSDQLDVFTRLCMYQQLWLQYGDDFFIRLHQKVREENLDLTTREEKMAYFILKSCEVSGNNLKDFFKEWGFILDEQYFQALDNLGLPDPDMDITSLRE